MKNPGFQDYFMPVLIELEDGRIKERNVIIESVANYMQLSDEMRKELLPNQSQHTYVNRIGWAMTYLKKSGLLLSPSRSMWGITTQGQELLRNQPDVLNVSFLKRNYPSFKEFHTINREVEKDITSENQDIPPYESLLESFNLIKKNECEDLLSKILEQSSEFFEKLVIDLLLKMGYGGSKIDAGEAIGKSGDEGIDGTISEDRLGLDTIYIQAKRWKLDNVVGRPEIQKFVGALSGQNARKGIFITTSRFSSDARNYKPKNDLTVVLIDGNKLVDLMYEYSVGVNEVETLVIKQIDNDYFE